MKNKKLDFTALEDLPDKDLSYDKGKYSNIAISLLIFFVLVPFVTAMFSSYLTTNFTQTNTSPAVLLWFTAVVIIAITIFIKSKSSSASLNRNHEIIQKCLKKFALANEFSISMREVKLESKALTMSFVDTQTLEAIPGFETRILKGKFAGFPMKLSDLVYVKVYRIQGEEPLKGRVMRLKLPQKLPHMIIDCHVDSAAMDLMGNSDLKGADEILHEPSNTMLRKIDLEGDFHKYFSLYTQKNNAVNALSILTPDVMQTLLDMNALCDIEIIDNYIYFVWSERKMNKTAYEKVFITVQSVMDQIGYKLSHSDFTSRTKPIASKTLAAKDSDIIAKQSAADKGLNKISSAIAIVLLAMIIPAWMYSKGTFSNADSTYEVARGILLLAYATIVIILPTLIIAALVALIVYLGIVLPRKRKRINSEFRKNYRRK